MDTTKTVLAVLLLAAVGAAIYFALAEPPSWEEETRGLFGEGRAKVTEGRYDDAIPSLSRYIEKHPQGRNASRAQFFIAKAHLGRGDLAAARQAFETVIRVYPDSLEAHKSRYKIALVDLCEGREDDARKRFRELADHPDGPLAPEAAAMTAFLDGSGRSLTAPVKAEAE